MPSTAIYFVPGGMESFSGDSAAGSLVGIELGLRDHDVIVVPSVTFHGSRLFDALLGRVPGSPPPPRRPPWR